MRESTYEEAAMLSILSRIFSTPCNTIPSSQIPSTPPDGFRINPELEAVGGELARRVRHLFHRSLRIREVDTGSCNACEWEITALTNPVYDVSRFGIDIVASPRHADMLLVTGPVTRQMEEALLKTYEATPNPKIVVAVGDCACGKGLFEKSYACSGGLEGILPVDGFIPGCPPSPLVLIQGILAVIDAWSGKRSRY
jgi:Ni,Fe-hydrogenase III small subunit